MSGFAITIKNEQRSDGDYSLYCTSNGFQWWYMGLTYTSLRTAQAAERYLLKSKGVKLGEKP